VPESVASEVLAVYNRDFELPRLYPGAGAAVVGRFVDSTDYRVTMDGDEVACAPVSSITEGVEYERSSKAPGSVPASPELPDPDPAADLRRLLTSVNGASRRPVWSYYDSEVQGATHLRPGEADAVVVRPVEGCPAGLAVSVDGNPWYGSLDPFRGGAHAVGEAVRNVVATGAVPLAVTDCLNYGNPEQPEVFWQFRRGVEGITEACSHLGLDHPGEPLPVVSGNVSFYNQSAGGRGIPPSPVVACFGRLDRFTDAVDISLKGQGNPLLLVGPRRRELGGSLWQRVVAGGCGGEPPRFCGEEERRMAELVLRLIRSGAVVACHDISEGGLMLAAAEMALATRGATGLGVRLELDADPALLFSETPGYLLELERHAVEGLDIPPDLCRPAGRVVEGLLLGGDGWECDLEELADSREELLHRVVWREEGIDG
jgi:phosphoribosylformylglycinamidine synthase